MRGLYCLMKSTWNSLSSSGAHESLPGNSFFSSIISSKRSASISLSTSSSRLLLSSSSDESGSISLGELYPCFCTRPLMTRSSVEGVFRRVLAVPGVFCSLATDLLGVAIVVRLVCFGPPAIRSTDFIFASRVCRRCRSNAHRMSNSLRLR